MTLRDLPQNTPATITGFDDADHDMQTRLREIGFAEGDRVEALHFGLFGRNPMSVRLNGALIAMRKHEASAVLVERLTDA
ncbi:MAG: FeoA family protein [Alphaproteobacteria bacterium]